MSLKPVKAGSDFWLHQDDELRVLEAYLFQQAEPKSCHDIHRDFQNAGYSWTPEKTQELLESLVAQYKWVNGALAVVKTTVGNYQLRMRDEYYPVVSKFTWKKDLSTAETRTLATIAFLQPVTLTELRKARKVSKKDLEELEGRGFLTKSKVGKTTTWETTSFFAEYFNLPADREEIQEKLVEELENQES